MPALYKGVYTAQSTSPTRSNTQQHKSTNSNTIYPIYNYNKHNQKPFTILIPHDTTLILARTASKRIQQLGYVIKQNATPHPHGCGVKGELRTLKSATQNDTTHRPKQRRAKQHYK